MASGGNGQRAVGPRRVRVSRRRNRVEERAVRAAQDAGIGPLRRQPAILRGGFLFWACTRILAFVVLLGAAWLVYESATSDSFQVRALHISGNVLLTQPEVAAVVAARGANLFWVDRREIEARLRLLPPVRSVTVTPILPDTLDVRVEERQPAAFWLSGDHRYLVDREGVILTSIDDSEAPPACSGQPCDPRQAPPLLTVAEPEGQPLTPGERVDATALAASARLAALLPAVGVQPVAFEWSTANGLEVPTQNGWRVRFDGSSGDIEHQVNTLRTIRDYLARGRVNAQLIDVRFGDRSYYR